MPGGVLLVLSLLAMVVNRHEARLVVLARAGGPPELPVHPQWSVFGLFLACFLAMLAVGAWMLRLFFGAGADAKSARA